MITWNELRGGYDWPAETVPRFDARQILRLDLPRDEKLWLLIQHLEDYPEEICTIRSFVIGHEHRWIVKRALSWVE